MSEVQTEVEPEARREEDLLHIRTEELPPDKGEGTSYDPILHALQRRFERKLGKSVRKRFPL